TLPLHDALPISADRSPDRGRFPVHARTDGPAWLVDERRLAPLRLQMTGRVYTEAGTAPNWRPRRGPHGRGGEVATRTKTVASITFLPCPTNTKARAKAGCISRRYCNYQFFCG